MHKLSAKIYDSLVTECSRFIESRVDTLSHKVTTSSRLNYKFVLYSDQCKCVLIRNLDERPNSFPKIGRVSVARPLRCHDQYQEHIPLLG